MPTTLNAYVGRDFDEIILLEYLPVGGSDYETVPIDTVTRAVFRFGDYCIDTDEVEHADLISLTENATQVEMKIGMISGLVQGTYKGWLTIFDAVNTNGIPWQLCKVQVWPWPICPVVEES
jgi:hypothetical protein